MTGMKGENIIDDSVWIFKTHFPLHDYKSEVGKASKIISTVRNPLDTLNSMYIMAKTNCLGASMTEESFAQDYEEFRAFCKSSTS
jgi:hypothetical protein